MEETGNSCRILKAIYFGNWPLAKEEMRRKQ
jgi:hypothetical protein